MAVARNMDRLPPVVPPLPGAKTDWRCDLPTTAALDWLAAGWKDFTIRPVLSIAYGLFVFGISIGIVGGLFFFGHDYILFPALSGFLVVGPLIAAGLYEKSRRIEKGAPAPATIAGMLIVKPGSGGQMLFMGMLLCLLMVLWMRAAVLLYALFFGLLPFPGLDDIVGILLGTPEGWALIIVGSLVGGLFAAFSFAISVFAVPMLLDQRTDALTAMGKSMALVWNNLPVMLSWGAIVVALFALSVATGLIGLIVVFPVLGHATWHAYGAVRERTREADEACVSAAS